MTRVSKGGGWSGTCEGESRPTRHCLVFRQSLRVAQIHSCGDHHVGAYLGVGDIGQMGRGDEGADSRNIPSLDHRGDEESDFVDKLAFAGLA